MDAAGTLAAALKEAEFARPCARSARRARDSGHQQEGAPLQPGRDNGGLLHFFDGDPVHLGEPLMLRTTEGWPRIRYQWLFREEAEPLGYLSLPSTFEFVPQAVDALAA